MPFPTQETSQKKPIRPLNSPAPTIHAFNLIENLRIERSFSGSIPSFGISLWWLNERSFSLLLGRVKIYLAYGMGTEWAWIRQRIL